MFVEEMLFILGHRDVEDVDAFVREMDGKAKTLNKIIEAKHWSDTHENYSVHDFVEMIEKADMLDRIEEMGVVTVYDGRHWTTDYNILKAKAEKLGNLDDYPMIRDGPITVLEYLDLVLLQADTYTKRALNVEGKLEAVKDVLKLPDCKSSEETPDLILGFEEQFYLKKILEGDGSGGTET